ncbi:MAG: Xaa-Pro peptidase family protein [Sphingomonadales bacterium]
MRPEIVSRLVAIMSQQDLDAIIAVSPENFAYVTGFVVPSQPLMRWRHAAAIVTRDGEQAILCVDMEESTVRAKAGDTTVVAWGEFSDDPMNVLAEMLSQMGLAQARVGTEFDYLSAGAFAALNEIMPGLRLVAAEKLLARARQIKTVQEIAHMHRLSRIADQAIYDALMAVAPGSSEMDIAGALTRNIFALGAENFKLMIVATGERSVYPNVGPSDRVLKEGDICRVEIFSMIGGYHAGVCRTARVGKAPPHAETIWQNLVECKYLVLDMIKPGASSRAVYEAFLKHLSKLNLPPIRFVGHGIGLHLHEQPYLASHMDVPLEDGMVLGIEPLVYNTGHGYGMQNKDIVAVTATGSQLLSDFTNTDQLLVVS